MASISLPYGFRNVQLAERLAAANNGVVLEQHPAGYVTVEASPDLRVTRALVAEVYGQAPSDASWRGLATRRHGLIAMLTDSEFLVRDGVLETGYLVSLPAEMVRAAEAKARERGSTLQELVIDAVRRAIAS
jgi:hypothetical protein